MSDFFYPRWELDFLRRPFAPRRDPLPRPGAGVFDSPYVTLRVNVAWVSHILGALEVLNQPDSWSGAESDIEGARQEVEKLLRALALGMGDEMGIQGVRQTGDKLEYTFDGVLWIPFATLPPTITGATASTLAPGAPATAQIAAGVLQLGIPQGAQGEPGAPGQDGAQGQPGEPGAPGAPGQDGLTFTSVQASTLDPDQPATGAVTDGVLRLGIPRGVQGSAGPQGIQGAQGIQGIQGPPGDDCNCASDVPPVENPDNTMKCNIAWGLGEWLQAKFGTHLAIARQVIAAGRILADYATDIAEAIPFIGPLAAAHADMIANTTDQAFEDLIDINTPEFKEAIQCQIYCYLKTQTGDINDSTISGILEHLKTWGATYPPQGPLLIVIGQAFAVFLLLFDGSSHAEILRRARIYQNIEANCEVCTSCPDVETWCRHFDFTASDGGFVKYGTAGQWVSGSGWQTTPRGYGYAVLGTFNRYFTAAYVTEIEIVVAHTAVDPWPNQSLGVYLGPTQIASVLIDGTIGTQTFTLAVNGTIDTISFNLDTDGTHSIQRGVSLTVRGTGAIPPEFGASNCT